MAEPVPIALYLSAVEGHHVTRYGTGRAIGAFVDLAAPGNLRWDTETIVAIPEREYDVYRREYDDLVKAGALKKRTKEEYEAYQSKRTEAVNAAARAEADKAKAAADKAARPPPPPPQDEAEDEHIGTWLSPAEGGRG